jgi:cytoskeletal protein CcmA (bactofilin family)
VCVHKGRRILQHPQKKNSIVEKGLTIDGEVSFTGQLTVMGTVKGSLVGEHIVIAEEGVVVAETKATFITIAGTFRGRLTVAGQLLVLSTGNCSGIIECQDLQMEAGGVLNGNINCPPSGL